MRTRRLVYVDYFTDLNSNYYWLEAFKNAFSEVYPIDVFTELKGESVQYIVNKIRSYNPDMVHFGGSVKTNGVLPLQVYATLKLGNPDIRLTAHYGDVYYSEYNYARLQYLSAFHTTNYCNIASPYAYYAPCCVLDRWIDLKPKHIVEPSCSCAPNIKHSCDRRPSYDVVFVGNNYGGRSGPLKEIASSLKDTKHYLHVFGSGWKDMDNIVIHNPISVEKSIEVYKDSKVVLGDFTFDYCRNSSIDKRCICGQTEYYKGILCSNKMCSHYAPTIGWFSNRLINMLASGATVVTAYKTGMDILFKKDVHIFWYYYLKEALQLIKYGLDNYTEFSLKKLALQKYIKENFTYEKAVEKLINFKPEYK